MKISKVDKAMLMDQFNKPKSKEKDLAKKVAVKRDKLELSGKAKELQKERDDRFQVSKDEETKKDIKKSVKRAEILPFKKRKNYASRYSVGTE